MIKKVQINNSKNEFKGEIKVKIQWKVSIMI